MTYAELSRCFYMLTVANDFRGLLYKTNKTSCRQKITNPTAVTGVLFLQLFVSVFPRRYLKTDTNLT